jgi:hypothetical protein
LEAAMEGRDAVARESLQATVRFASTKGMDLFFVMRLVCRVFFFREPVSCSRGFSISLRNFMIFFLVGFGFGFGFVLLCFRERLV